MTTRHNHTNKSAEALHAMTKEQVIKHALDLQEKLDRALTRAYEYGQALTATGYFADKPHGNPHYNERGDHAQGN